jgi:hypothetical protein
MIEDDETAPNPSSALSLPARSTGRGGDGASSAFSLLREEEVVETTQSTTKTTTTRRKYAVGESNDGGSDRLASAPAPSPLVDLAPPPGPAVRARRGLAEDEEEEDGPTGARSRAAAARLAEQGDDDPGDGPGDGAQGRRRYTNRRQGRGSRFDRAQPEPRWRSSIACNSSRDPTDRSQCRNCGPRGRPVVWLVVERLLQEDAQLASALKIPSIVYMRAKRFVCLFRQNTAQLSFSRGVVWFTTRVCI